MGELLVGSYWKNRKLSMREYADKTKRQTILPAKTGHILIVKTG
jgi:hypothetical protein